MQDIIKKQQELIEGQAVESENFANISGLIFSIPEGETRTINGIQVSRTLLGRFQIADQTFHPQSIIRKLWDAQS